MARAMRVNWRVCAGGMGWVLFWNFMVLSLKYGTFLLRWLAAVHEEIDRIRVKQPGGDPIVDGVAVRAEKAAYTSISKVQAAF